MDFIELRKRLLNWSRLYREERGEPHRESSLHRVLIEVGYVPEFSSHEGCSLPIDYRDARVIDKAYNLLEDPNVKEYIGVYYCTRMGVARFCRRMNLPVYLFDAFERECLESFRGVLDTVENPSALGARQHNDN